MCGKCKNVMTIEADFDQRFAIISPKKCKNEECEGTTIVPHADGMIFVKDYQEIKIQVCKRFILVFCLCVFDVENLGATFEFGNGKDARFDVGEFGG